MIHIPRKAAVGMAHSKLILIGEHAVVYGKPAIALPFPILEVKSIVEETSDCITIDCNYYVGPLQEIPKKMAGITACIEATLSYLKKPHHGLRIQIVSSIPIGRGLGSSAALAIAIVKSLFYFHGEEPTREELMKLVHLAETYAHGNPSGIDMEAALSDCPIWFQKGKKSIPLQLGAKFYLIVADTGQIGDTHSAVDSIAEKQKNEPIKTNTSIDLLGELAHQAKSALVRGEISSLGDIVNLAQGELVKLGVSDYRLDRLVNAARHAGALGAKLTGGGRGGCMIALASNQSQAQIVAKKLMRAGAQNTWYFKVEEDK